MLHPHRCPFPASGRGDVLSRKKGYTLIEILVVLFIISIVTSVALLSISVNKNRQLKTVANELVEVLSLAQEEAMLKSSVLGLLFNQHSFELQNLQAQLSQTQKNIWLPIENKELGKHNLPKNVEVKVVVGNTPIATFNDQEKINPQIIISNDGNITPFTIYIGSPGKKPRYEIIGDADGRISSKSLSD